MRYMQMRSYACSRCMYIKKTHTWSSQYFSSLCSNSLHIFNFSSPSPSPPRFFHYVICMQVITLTPRHQCEYVCFLSEQKWFIHKCYHFFQEYKNRSFRASCLVCIDLQRHAQNKATKIERKRDETCARLERFARIHSHTFCNEWHNLLQKVTNINRETFRKCCTNYVSQSWVLKW